MDELTTLIKELEHQPPESLARQRMRLMESARSQSAPSGRVQRGRTWLGLPSLARRGLVLGVAAAGVAVAVAVPGVIGSGVPAYALTKNADGSITFQVREFRDSEQVERDLAKLGVRADITYLPYGKWCGNTRAPFLKGEDEPAANKEDLRQQVEHSASFKALRPGHGLTIYPQRIAPGQIALIEVSENPSARTTGGTLWTFIARLTPGPVQPCQIADAPWARH